MSFSAQLTPGLYHVLPFILITRLQDENDKPAGWLLACGWLGGQLNFVFGGAS